MSVQTLLLIALTIGLAIAQYGLAWFALHDLAQRSRVRGGNKVLWGLLVLCLPLAGAVVYSWMGPMGFRRRLPASSSLLVNPVLATARSRDDLPGDPPPNVTPIKRPARPTRLSHVVGSTTVTLEPREGTRSIVPSTRYRRVGS